MEDYHLAQATILNPSKSHSFTRSLSTESRQDQLGLWIKQHEGARFWLGGMNALKTWGVGDILIAVVDGLKGFSEAIRTVFPQPTVQTCIVHQTRFSLAYFAWQNRDQVAAQFKGIYQAGITSEGRQRLEAFAQSKLGRKYKLVGPSWRRHWEEVIPLYDYPPKIRKMI